MSERLRAMDEKRSRPLPPASEERAPAPTAHVPTGTATDIARFVFKYLRFLLAVPLATTLLVAALVYLLPQSYVARSVVLIEGRKSPTMRAESLDYPIETYEVVSSEMEIIRSRGVAELVVDRLELDRPPERIGWSRRLRQRMVDFLDETGLVEKVAPRESAIRGVQNNIELKQPAQSSVLEIRYADSDPERAAQVARAVTEAYIERHHQIFIDNSGSFFEARAAEAEQNLQTVRAALRRESDAMRLQELQLQVAAEEKSYLFYRERLNAARADAAANPSLANVRVIDWPTVPSRPRFARLLLLILAALGGIVLAVALALLRDYFDHRVYSPDDLAKVSPVPVLGSVRRSGAARRLWQRGQSLST